MRRSNAKSSPVYYQTMRIDRVRPTEKDKEDLALWLSGVVNDALRDAIEAGLPPEDAESIVTRLGKAHNNPALPR